MDDATYEGLRDAIEGFFDYWQPRLGLKWWSIENVYHRDASTFEVDGTPTPDTTACCKADWRYLHASIRWNMLRVSEQDEAHLENIVVHELCHILVNETRGPALKGFIANEERVCSTLAQAFIWTRDMSRDGSS